MYGLAERGVAIIVDSSFSPQPLRASFFTMFEHIIVSLQSPHAFILVLHHFFGHPSPTFFGKFGELLLNNLSSRELTVKNLPYSMLPIPPVVRQAETKLLFLPFLIFLLHLAPLIAMFSKAPHFYWPIGYYSKMAPLLSF